MTKMKHIKPRVTGVEEDLGPVLLPPTMDFVFKGLFGNEKKPEILISFLNAVLTPEEPITSITFKDRTLDRRHRKDKLGVLDLLAETDKGELVNIEVQLADENDMIERSLFYWSRLFSGQLESGYFYDQLERTICINILDFNLMDTDDYHSSYRLKERDRNDELTDLLEIHYIELKKMKDITDVREVKTQLEAWIEFLKHPQSRVSYELAHQHEPIREAKEELLALSCDQKYRLHYEARFKEWMDRHNRLHYAEKKGMQRGLEKGLQQGIEQGIQQGIGQGIEQGIEQGIQQGIEQGVKKGAIEIATNLLDILDNETIATKTGLSVVEVAQIRKKSTY